MKIYINTVASRLPAAVAYFDKLTTSGQFAGMAALALRHVANTWNIAPAELRAAIETKRKEESVAI